jgi:hypothetical protein
VDSVVSELILSALSEVNNCLIKTKATYETFKSGGLLQNVIEQEEIKLQT